MDSSDGSEVSGTKVVLWVILFFVVLMGFGWIVQGNDFFLYRFFAPKYEQVRRETYEQTKSYRQGSIQRLDTLCTQIDGADDGHKPMLYDVIRQEFVEWNETDVPVHLRPCLAQARAH